MSQLEVQHHWKSWIQIVLENWQSSKILGSAASVTGTERTSKNDTNKYEKDLRVQHNHTWETHQTWVFVLQASNTPLASHRQEGQATSRPQPYGRLTQHKDWIMLGILRISTLWATLTLVSCAEAMMSLWDDVWWCDLVSQRLSSRLRNGWVGCMACASPIFSHLLPSSPIFSHLLPSSPIVLRKELAHWLDWQGKLLASSLETSCWQLHRFPTSQNEESWMKMTDWKNCEEPTNRNK